MRHDNLTLVLGPPGTGKTTKLLSLIQSELRRGVSLEKICFLSFTRNAADEAVERCADKFNLAEKSLPYFRTIHSLCYLLAGVQNHQVLRDGERAKIAHDLRLPSPVFGKAYGGYLPYTNILYNTIDEARIKQSRLETIWRESRETIAIRDLQDLFKALTRYKEVNYKYDFTDFLEKFLELDDALVPEFDTIFIDEAQDLSRLQWAVLHKLCSKTKKVYVAGDDDQTIYTWAGADLRTFLSLFQTAKETIILDQSYRVPKSIHKIADSIINKISLRIKKNYNPTPEEGSVTEYDSFADVHAMLNRENFARKTDKWLILARNNHQIEKAKLHLEDIGITEGKDTNFRFSTIHSAKGSEEDNVILLTGTSRKTELECQDSPHKQDDETRLFYVGVTRAKKTLHLVKPEGQFGYDIKVS